MKKVNIIALSAIAIGGMQGIFCVGNYVNSDANDSVRGDSASARAGTYVTSGCKEVCAKQSHKEKERKLYERRCNSEYATESQHNTQQRMKKMWNAAQTQVMAVRSTNPIGMRQYQRTQPVA